MSINPHQPQEINGRVYTPEQMRNANIYGGESQAEAFAKMATHQANEAQKKLIQTQMQNSGSGGYGGLSLAQMAEAKRVEKNAGRKMVRWFLVLVVGVLSYMFLNVSELVNDRIWNAKDRYRETIRALEDSVDLTAPAKPIPESQDSEIRQFKEVYSGLFKDNTPYEKMFENCFNKYNCNNVSKAATNKLLPYAKEPNSLFDQMCTVDVNQQLKENYWIYNGNMPFTYLPKQGYVSASCISADKEYTDRMMVRIKIGIVLEILAKVLLPMFLTAWLLSMMLPYEPKPKY